MLSGGWGGEGLAVCWLKGWTEDQRVSDSNLVQHLECP